MPRPTRSITPPPAEDQDAHASEVTATQDDSAVFVLDDARRRELDAKAQALSVAEVVRAPSYLDAQLLHASVLQTRATRDLPMLTKVPVDGSFVTADEVREAGYAIAYAREASAAHSAASSAAQAKHGVKRAPSVEAAPSPETLSLAALRAEVKHHRGVILGALDLRFRGDPEGRKVLQRVRALNRDAKLVTGTTTLLGLCQSPKHKDWIASLPRGESRSVARLAAVAPVFAKRLAEPNASRVDLRALKARRDRAWTLVHRACERLRAAGSYLTRDDPARKNDYRAYKRPARTKKPT